MSYLYMLIATLSVFAIMLEYSAAHTLFAQSNFFYLSCAIFASMLILIREATHKYYHNNFFTLAIQGLSATSGLILSEGYRTSDAGLMMLALIIFTITIVLLYRLVNYKIIP